MPAKKKSPISLNDTLESISLDSFSPEIGESEAAATNAFEFKKEAPVNTDSPLNVPDFDDTSFSELLDYSFPEDIHEGVTQIGEVIYIGDGVCKVAGLPNAQVEDIITVKTASGPVKALILGLEDTYIESVVMGEYSKIKQGDQVIAKNEKLRIPVGKGLFGRVINPLGDPVDGKGRVKSDGHRNIEFPAPSVMQRYPILKPLKTGVMVVDTTIPIGRGQRELVIGDRKTGKTHTCIDIICNQKGSDISCVYVGVGIQAAKAKGIQQTLEERGAMAYTTMVVAMSNEPPSLQYMAPYSGSAIAESLMYQGKHVLIVYDDLSKQAKAYRQVSLLLKRSPGRDAYPGDIFFLHSRLLERACKVNKKMGFGSITALPVAETQAGDVSDYIITNLMSITDGHIYLDANMMHEGILPAVNSGTSVSRIGSKVQTNLLKKMGELASRTMARYEEVKSFETINTEVAEDTLRDIRRGKRVREIFSQDSNVCYTYDEQVVMIHLVVSGILDDLELFEFGNFKSEFLEYYRKNRTDELVKQCDTSKNIEEIEGKIKSMYDAYMKTHKSNSGSFVIADNKAGATPGTTPAPDEKKEDEKKEEKK